MKLSKIIAGAILIAGFTACNSATSKKDVSPYEAKIDKLMSKMTLDEKVGQMSQFCVDLFVRPEEPDVVNSPLVFDSAKANVILGQLKAGSILNTPGGVAHSPAEWGKIISKMQAISMQATGIPMIYGIDAIHGGTYTAGAVFFPQGIGMGATFNRQLVHDGAQISAYETRASDIPWTFSPVLDLGRNACWPRMWENYGEDAYLNAEMGVACVKGFQGDDRDHIGMNNVAACLKHYMGYGVPVSGQDRTPAMIPENELRERHLLPYSEAVKAGALSVMVNSSSINGEPVHASHHILTDILKDELHFDGVICTDWQDINNLYVRDHIAKDDKEAIMLSINAGVDMAMIPYDTAFCRYLTELVNEKKVATSRIDDAVRRVLRMKYRLGLFDNPTWDITTYKDFASEEHQQKAKAAADESITLLKNHNSILPLKKGTKILVTGPNATTKRVLNGGWTVSWQGDKVDLYEKLGATVLQALQDKAGKENVIFEPGVTYNDAGKYYDENKPEIEKAVAAARSANVIIACIGENSYCETPGNLTSLDLSTNQINLVTALAKTGKPIVLVLNEGRPRIISAIDSLASAVVQMYLPGSFGGISLADILYGDVNPSGKLPYTYPKYSNLLTNYDYKPSENRATMDGTYFYEANNYVQYPFGYGLSYTKFDYSELKVNKDHFNAADQLEFSVKVTNSGQVAGKESVLLFTSDDVASLTPDNRRLRAFDKVSLAPGESKTVTLEVPASHLAFMGLDNKWRLEKGTFTVRVGDQKLVITADETKVWDTYLR